MPNVGKSTLFNALSQAGAESANYPFCTIEPNVGMVPVPDERLGVLGRLNNSKKVVPATIEFVDIAGLVAGASKGEGLGNKFLAHIREVDAIVHVVRCFDDEDVVHVSGRVDPASDIEIIETELLLKDLEAVEKRIERTTKVARSGDKVAREELGFYERVLAHLSDGGAVRALSVSEKEQAWLGSLFLLSGKPVLYAANVSEADLPGGNAHVDAVRARAEEEGAGVVVVSAELEAQVAELEPEERVDFMSELGLTSGGLERLIQSAYALLDLITFFTSGPTETRAWTIPRGLRAPQAAGQIHSDFERGFIRAETIAYEDYARLGSESKARDAGLMRSEGKEYTVRDGDVLLFRFNV